MFMIRSVRIVGRSKTRELVSVKDYIDHIFEPFSQEKDGCPKCISGDWAWNVDRQGTDRTDAWRN